jgi:hypothetical protein
VPGRKRLLLLLLCRTIYKKTRTALLILGYGEREAGDLDLHKASMILFALQVYLVRLLPKFTFHLPFLSIPLWADGLISGVECRWRFCGS